VLVWDHNRTMTSTTEQRNSRFERIVRLTFVYEQGRRAFKQVRGFQSSGYVRGSDTEKAWQAGWLDAEQSEITGRDCYIRRP